MKCGPSSQALLLLSVLALVGCIYPSDSGASDESPENPKELIFKYNRPVLINQTMEPGFFFLEAEMHENCFNHTNYFPYAIYDSSGKRYDHMRVPLDQGIQTIKIELEGEAPHVIVGNPRPVCAVNTTIRGLAEATVLNAANGFSMNEARQESYYDLVVPVGSKEAEVQVVTPEWTIDLVQVGPWNRDWPPTYGTITSRANDYDYIMRQDYFPSIGSPETTVWSGYRHMPGGFVIELELEEPAVWESRWEYLVEHHVFRKETGICNFGLEWEICR